MVQDKTALLEVTFATVISYSPRTRFRTYAILLCVCVHACLCCANVHADAHTTLASILTLWKVVQAKFTIESEAMSGLNQSTQALSTLSR